MSCNVMSCDFFGGSLPSFSLLSERMPFCVFKATTPRVQILNISDVALFLNTEKTRTEMRSTILRCTDPEGQCCESHERRLTVPTLFKCSRRGGTSANQALSTSDARIFPILGARAWIATKATTHPDTTCGAAGCEVPPPSRRQSSAI